MNKNFRRPISFYAKGLWFLCVPMHALTEENTRTVEKRIVSESNPIEINAFELSLSATALQDFKLKYKNWNCFTAFMYNEDGYWRVDFGPKDDIEEVGDKLIVGASKCGRGMSIIMNHKGEIIKRIYAK